MNSRVSIPTVLEWAPATAVAAEGTVAVEGTVAALIVEAGIVVEAVGTVVVGTGAASIVGAGIGSVGTAADDRLEEEDQE